MMNQGRLSRASGFLASFSAIEARNLNAPIALISMYISHNSAKTAEPLSMGIVKNEKTFRFHQKSYVKSVSLLINRRDYFSMSDRANIWEPGTPETKLRSTEREGVFYEGRKEDSGQHRS